MRALGWLGFAVAATVLMGAPARAELVTNGSFSTGDFAGWTNPGGGGIVIDDTFAAPGDTYDAAFTGTGTLSQSIATAPGTGYVLGFSLQDESGYFGDTFTVGFGGFSTTITGDTAVGYTAEAFVVPGADITGSSTTLSFQGVNLETDWNLDDVSVTEQAIPEPPVDAVLITWALGLMMLGWRRKSAASGLGGVYRLGGPA